MKSPSHPLFSDLYDQFYISKIKTITKDNIKLLDHPVGLACLYLDDGTLMINALKRKYKISLLPNIGITTLCFSKEECQIIIDHILTAFNIEFHMVKHPDGRGYTIKTTKLDHTFRFIDLILPHCSQIQCMRYKWDIPVRLEGKKSDLIQKYGNSFEISICSTKNIPKSYSKEQEEQIINMKLQGKTDAEIADTLNRSYREKQMQKLQIH